MSTLPPLPSGVGELPAARPTLDFEAIAKHVAAQSDVQDVIFATTSPATLPVDNNPHSPHRVSAGWVDLAALALPAVKAVLAHALPPLVAQVKTRVPGVVHSAMTTIEGNGTVKTFEAHTGLSLSALETPIVSGIDGLLDTMVLNVSA